MQDINHYVGCENSVDVGRINCEKLFLFSLFISKFIKMNHPLITFLKVGQRRERKEKFTQRINRQSKILRLRHFI